MLNIFLAVEGGSLGAALVVGLIGFGAALAEGLAIYKSVDAIGRQPEADKKIRQVLMLGLVFIETLVIFGIFIAILILFV